MQRTFAELHTQVVKPTSNHHDHIREALFGIPQHVLDDARPLHTGERVLDAHPDPRDFPVAAFLGSRQRLLARLFFGWRISRTRGA